MAGRRDMPSGLWASRSGAEPKPNRKDNKPLLFRPTEAAFERLRPVMSVVKRAKAPIVSTLAGIASVPSRLVSLKAKSPIETSEAAADRPRPVSLVL
eukprot:scaffold95922_cov61-Phaeocystis_antarctica.AAC.3